MDDEIVKAIFEGDVDAVGRFLSEGRISNADLDGLGGKGALQVSAASRAWTSPQVLTLLLDALADPNRQDAQGMSAVHWAASTGSDANLKLLLLRGGSADAPTAHGMPPLNLAVRSSRVSHKVRLLLSFGASPNSRSSANTGAFAGMPAISCIPYSEGHVQFAEELLRAGANVNQPDAQGRTPLMFSAGTTDVNFMRLFLRQGADATALDNNCQNAIHHVFRGDTFEKVRLLLKAGGDVALVDKRGHSVLHRLLMRVHDPNTIELLLKAGAPIGPDSGSMEVAASFAWPPIVRIFLDYGAPVDGNGQPGKTPLQEAALRARGDVMEMLLESGADVSLLTAPNGGWNYIPVMNERRDCSAAMRLLDRLGLLKDGR